MTFKLSHGCAAIAAALVALLSGAPSAAADPVAIRQGAAQLPVSGLVIDLPAQAGIEYRVSGSWSTNTAGDTFDARDIVDEVDLASGKLTSGNWVLAGYFTAGDCEATLAGTTLDNAWTQDATLWGEAWKVRGGVFTFEGALGRKPAAVLCRMTSTGHSLMLYRFLIDQPETVAQSVIMDSVRGSAALASASRSYSALRTGDVYPTRRGEVRRRGEGNAARTVTLPVTGLVVDLPDDGYFWLLGDGEQSDMLDRLLPTLPEVSVEIAMGPGLSCEDVLAGLTTGSLPTHVPTNLPSGWTAGPALQLDGEIELTMCSQAGADALIFGIFQGATRTDVSSMHPLMAALLAAAKKP